MEVRRSKRAILDIPAEIINGDKRRAGTIENLSEAGLYVVTAPTKSEKELFPGTEIEIRFRLPSEEKVSLHCVVKWSYLTPPHGYTFSMGLEVKNPPATYLDAIDKIR